MPSFEARQALFEPGLVVEFDYASQLERFETMLLRLVNPSITPAQLGWWKVDYQTADTHMLKEAVRPKGFNGNLLSLALQVMPDPYERLLEAVAAKRARISDKAISVMEEAADYNRDYYLGFECIARASSSKHGNNGDVQAQLWYCPAWVYKDGKRVLGDFWRSGIRRVIPTPTYLKVGDRGPDYQAPAFQNVSRRIGLVALEQALVSPSQ